MPDEADDNDYPKKYVDDTECFEAEKSDEFARIALINRAYKAGHRRLEDYIATLAPSTQKKYNKILETPIPKMSRRKRKPKPR